MEILVTSSYIRIVNNYISYVSQTATWLATNNLTFRYFGKIYFEQMIAFIQDSPFRHQMVGSSHTNDYYFCFDSK